MMKIHRRYKIGAAALAATVTLGAVGTDLAIEHVADGRMARAISCRLKPTGPVRAQFVDPAAGLEALTGTLGTARIDADGIHRIGADLDLRIVLPDGTGLTLTTTAGPLGLPVTVHTSVTVAPHSLTITPTTITLMGQQLPVSALAQFPGASTALTSRLAPRTINLPQLPAGTELSSAHASPSGLSLVLTLHPAAHAQPAAHPQPCATPD